MMDGDARNKILNGEWEMGGIWRGTIGDGRGGGGAVCVPAKDRTESGRGSTYSIPVYHHG